MLWVGKIEGGRGGGAKAILDKGVEVISAESDPFEEHEGDPGENGPEEGGAARPAGNKQHPAIGRDVPDGQDNNPVEKEEVVQEVVSMSQRAGRAHSMDKQYHAGDKKNHQLSKDDYDEGYGGDDHERNHSLR